MLRCSFIAYLRSTAYFSFYAHNIDVLFLILAIACLTLVVTILGTFGIKTTRKVLSSAVVTDYFKTYEESMVPIQSDHFFKRQSDEKTDKVDPAPESSANQSDVHINNEN